MWWDIWCQGDRHQFSLLLFLWNLGKHCHIELLVATNFRYTVFNWAYNRHSSASGGWHWSQSSTTNSGIILFQSFRSYFLCLLSYCLEYLCSKSYLMSFFGLLFAIICCSMKMKTVTKSYLHLTVTLLQQWTMQGLLVGRYGHFFHVFPVRN